MLLSWAVTKVPFLFWALSNHGVAGDDGGFERPPASVRARFRYWLPDASVDPETLKADIHASASLGAGGVELLPFYNYGGGAGGAPPGLNWSTYNFGTPAFLQLFRAALEAHRETGTTMDFSLGPNQGQGVPAAPDDEGLQWDLIPYSALVPEGGTFDGVLPGWGVGDLVAATSATVISSTNISGNPATPSYLRLVVQEESMADVTGQVSSTGELHIEFPAAENGTAQRIFAFYQQLSHHKNLEFDSNSTATIFDNGSYTVDHYSARGAKTVTDFWDHYILVDGIKELLQEVGHTSWEDSIEARSNISWTPSIPAAFEEKWNYSLKRFLPLVIFAENNINLQRGMPGAYQVFTDGEDAGNGHINDYREVLADGYRSYVRALRNWARTTLNSQYSAQPAYNLPMDMEATIPELDIPECESLQFRDNVDSYRQFSGPANVAGKDIISVELGAIFGRAFSYDLSDLAFAVKRAISGGVNQAVVHGQQYTGNYSATTWPGYVSFGYQVSDQYSDKRPDWDHGLAQTFEYIGRVQYVHRQGVPRTDVAMYNKQSATDPIVHTLYQSDDLLNGGWSYTYLSPYNFNLSQAYVRDGVLAPDGPAYKAMVVTSDQNLTIEGITYLKDFAQNNLPIIVAGGNPGYYPSNSSEQATTEGAISDLLSTTNVYQVGGGEVAGQLTSLGLTAQVGVQTNGTWYTTWREDADSGIDYAFVFSDLEPSEGEITIASTKTPYVFNAWTGSRTPLLAYTVSDNKTIIPLSLGGNQSTIVAFTDKLSEAIGGPPYHVTQMPPDILGYSYNDSSITLHVPAALSSSISRTASLSTGLKASLGVSDIPPAFQLGDWTLTAEHWEAPADLYNAAIPALKRNTTHNLSTLVPWNDIPGLANASGVGYYTTQFTWPPSSSPSSNTSNTNLGAYLRLTPAKTALLITLNNKPLPPIDFTNPLVDISPYLVPGEDNNELLIRTPTTMWNYIRSILPKLENAGSRPSFSGGSYSSLSGLTVNGLLGPVEVVPFVGVVV